MSSTPVTPTPPSPIDMFTPAQTCASLGVDESVLLDMVNVGRLAAYRIGTHIRFKVSEVRAASTMLMVAS